MSQPRYDRGDVLTFQYSGGTHNGQRCVYVLEELSNNKNIGAYDFDAQEYRQFTKAKMSKIVKPSRAIVSLHNMPKNFDAANLVNQFESDGKLAFHDTTLDSVTTFVRPRATDLTAIFASVSARLEVDGRRILTIWSNGEITVNGNKVRTTDELIKTLQKRIAEL